MTIFICLDRDFSTPEKRAIAILGSQMTTNAYIIILKVLID